MVGLLYWEGPRDRQGNANLVMLPGHEDEGTMLIEYAVNLSEGAGCEGRAYFEQFTSPVSRLHYDPPWLQDLKSANVVPREEENEWVDLDGVWRLKINFRDRTTKSPRKVHNPDLLFAGGFQVGEGRR